MKQIFFSVLFYMYLILLALSASAQQWVIAEKDRTRPEINRFVSMRPAAEPLPTYNSNRLSNPEPREVDISPVELYPTIITGNTLNARSFLPVERITVISRRGDQVYMKEMGGVMESMTIVLPTLAPGVYFAVFQGMNWKQTRRFVIQ